jgi:hypothetical protein
MKKASSSTSSNNVGAAVGAAVDVDAVDNSKPYEEMSLEELCVRKEFLTRQSTYIGQQIVVVEEHIAQRQRDTRKVYRRGKILAYCCFLLLCVNVF